jgi:hypothetical protein
MSDEDGIAWWNALSASVRRYWLNQANSARPADAYAEYLRQREADPAAVDQAELEAAGGAITGTQPRGPR